jgi:hypothetical protein
MRFACISAQNKTAGINQFLMKGYGNTINAGMNDSRTAIPKVAGCGWRIGIIPGFPCSDQRRPLDFHCMTAPSFISSLALTITSSPACRDPVT